MKTIKISLETAKSIYGKDESIDRILRETFTNEELGIKPKLPKTWGDVGRVEGWYIAPDGEIDDVLSLTSGFPRSAGIYPTKEIAEAARALSQLLYLRDIYNDGWQPNWKGYDGKYTIFYLEDLLHVGVIFSTNAPMAFKTAELRDEFLGNFKELLEIAKPLI